MRQQRRHRANDQIRYGYTVAIRYHGEPDHHLYKSDPVWQTPEGAHNAGQAYIETARVGEDCPVGLEVWDTLGNTHHHYEIGIPNESRQASAPTELPWTYEHDTEEDEYLILGPPQTAPSVFGPPEAHQFMVGTMDKEADAAMTVLGTEAMTLIQQIKQHRDACPTAMRPLFNKIDTLIERMNQLDQLAAAEGGIFRKVDTVEPPASVQKRSVR